MQLVSQNRNPNRRRAIDGAQGTGQHIRWVTRAMPNSAATTAVAVALGIPDLSSAVAQRHQTRRPYLQREQIATALIESIRQHRRVGWKQTPAMIYPGDTQHSGAHEGSATPGPKLRNCQPIILRKGARTGATAGGHVGKGSAGGWRHTPGRAREMPIIEPCFQISQNSAAQASHFFNVS